MRKSSRPEVSRDLESMDDAEAKAAFHLRMRARGVRDLAVLRAFELVPRDFFVPNRYRDLAGRDLPVPIACGQTMPAPWLVARMIEALTVEPTHKVLEVGAGTGYATAILATLADEVIGFERFQTLARAAQSRLNALHIDNAAIVCGDGLAASNAVMFDRIIVHGLLASPAAFADRLNPHGVLVCGRVAEEGHAIARMRRILDGNWTETVVCGGRLEPIFGGAAAIL